MGKISEYLIELTEKFQDLLWNRETWHEAVNDMKEILSEDEFKFFLAHMDIIQANLRGEDEDISDEIYDDDDYMGPDAEDLNGDVTVSHGERTPYKGIMDEAYIMPAINEDWTFIQTGALTLLLGGLAINYLPKLIDATSTPEKREELKAGWKDWLENKMASISPKVRARKERREHLEQQRLTKENVKKAIQEFGEGKITLEEVEEIILHDERIAAAIKTLMQDKNLGYGRLYNALKDALGVQGVRGTPIPQIKDKFVGKAKDYQANRKVIRENIRVKLEEFANSPMEEEDLNILKLELKKIPEGGELINYINDFMQGKFYARDKFYWVLEKLFGVRLAKDTPGPKIVKNIKKKVSQEVITNESIVMSSISEWGNDRGDIYNDERADDWVDDDPDLIEDKTGKYFIDYKGDKKYVERY